jgi:hypothetical protein
MLLFTVEELPQIKGQLEEVEVYRIQRSDRIGHSLQYEDGLAISCNEGWPAVATGAGGARGAAQGQG